MDTTSPMSLPADYFNNWINECPTGTGLDSRVTASGFTESAIDGANKGKETFYKHPGAKLSAGTKKKANSRKPLTSSLESVNSVLNKIEGDTLRSSKDQLRSYDELTDEISRIESMREMIDIYEKKISAKSEFSSRNYLQTPHDTTASQKEQETQSPFDDKYRNLSDFTKFASDLSINPNDSASVFKPLNLEKKMGKLPAITEVTSDIPTMSVIGGFNQDVEQKIQELEKYRDIRPVNGLPIIFTNPRLNFLTHIHSALFKIISDRNGEYPSANCGELLLADRRYWSTDPATKLLETVLDRTIDVKTGVVIANPFNIPILEPTMILTQKLIFMAFDQLHSEFETEWFNTMKSVTTPRFHSKYEDLKYRRMSTSSKSNSDNDRTQSSRNTRSNSRRTSKSSSKSIVGSILGLD